MEWYLDSGATAHMTGQNELLCKVRKIRQISDRSDRSQKMYGIRNAKMQLKVSSVTNPIKLTNVFLVPDLCANLLSVSQLSSNGLRVDFSETRSYMNKENAWQ